MLRDDCGGGAYSLTRRGKQGRMTRVPPNAMCVAEWHLPAMKRFSMSFE
jgi:hypothetical protein